jgi:hypothetical protein
MRYKRSVYRDQQYLVPEEVSFADAYGVNLKEMADGG